MQSDPPSSTMVLGIWKINKLRLEITLFKKSIGNGKNVVDFPSPDDILSYYQDT